MLEMWIPGNSLITLTEIAESLRDAYATFARLAPETTPRGVYGESWRLDPQVLTVLPSDLGIHALQQICSLYPSALSEAKTLRRLFGPSADRAHLPDESTLDPMRRAIVQLLREHGVMVYWVGLPKMRDDHFDADIHQMNQFYAARMASLGVPYFETFAQSVDAGGQYEPYLPADPQSGERQAYRTNDGIHMTIPGYIYAMRGLSDRIRGTVAEARAQLEHEAPASGHAAARSGAESRS